MSSQNCSKEIQNVLDSALSKSDSEHQALIQKCVSALQGEFAVNEVLVTLCHQYIVLNVRNLNLKTHCIEKSKVIIQQWFDLMRKAKTHGLRSWLELFGNLTANSYDLSNYQYLSDHLHAVMS